MKVSIKVEKEVNIQLVKVALPVRYDDEDIPYDFPMREGDEWIASIEIDTGRILGWPAGVSGEMYMKVVDEGTYSLITVSGETVLSIEEDYVPNNLIPPMDGYGDYVHFIINKEGIIENWYKTPSINEFLSRD